MVCTVIQIESTAPPRDLQVEAEGPLLTIDVYGCDLNMPETEIPVHDGLVRSLTVRRPAPRLVRCQAELEHATTWRTEIAGDLPVRTAVLLDRSPVHRLFAGRTVVVDPGHGGRDEGDRGPINLREKNVVLDVARYLQDLLKEAGAVPVLTRNGDRDVPAAERLNAIPAGADCLVSIHTGHTSDPAVRGIRTLYAGRSPSAQGLAAAVQRALIAKLQLADRGVARARAAAKLPIPAVYVETVCLRNPIEEALMRSSVFKYRAAHAIWNGLKDHFATGGVSPARTWPPAIVKGGGPSWR